jgi:DNA-binding transcriptional LysR family regulator
VDIRQLQYFVETCKCNSFVHAAENCYITPQGIKMSINRLEDELGLKLLTITPKGLSPTKDGEYLLPIAEHIIQMISDCEAHFSESSNKFKNVTVMCIRGTYEKLTQNAISKFNEKNPDISINFSVGIDGECEDAVIKEKVDFALCSGPINSQKFDSTLLYKNKNVLVVNKNHSLARKEAISISDLRDLPLALQQKTTKSTNTLFALCKKEGFEPNVYTYVDDLRTAVGLAEINQCCGVMNLISAEKICGPNLRLIPFECHEMDWKIYLIKNKGSALSPLAKDLEKIFLKNSEVYANKKRKKR